MKVAVLDYGFGNVRSALRAARRAGAQAELTADPAAVAAADGLIVPGVGAFAAVMEGLRRVDGPRLIERRLAGGRPVLGICVGLQIMFELGEEHGLAAQGLGQWPGAVTKLQAPVVPHMGWSKVRAPEGSRLFEGVADQRFYFVHSYAAQDFPLSGAAAGPLAAPLVTWACHGGPFVAAVENGPLAATQFHPEKSGAAGARLLQNWIGTL
ncbi:MAG: imidazole glycerol phosphate synthase subunit HisH [Bifidobacteriaceae bacterium]|jgi:glutamine amidotransferase|nr:imidazole glycerol phosphate synthase subunit HisH [Bifidobacteriaceae bacterium]